MGTISRTGRFPPAQRAAAGGRRPFNGKGGGVAGLISNAAIGVADLLDRWQQRLRDRDMLRQMTTAQLKDIGVSRADALQEAEKPFWRA